jgi:predicted secreted protein
MAAVLVALALAGCSSSSPKAAKSKSSTTTSTTEAFSSTTTTAGVTTTTGGATTTSRVTTTTTTKTTGTVAPRTVTATAADNGKTLTLHVGDTLQVVLSGCGGCGYQWEMTGQPSTVVFQYEGESSSPSTTTTTVGQPPTVGAPVSYSWMFKAVSAHTTAFGAGYYPPSQTSPTQTYQLRLVVTTG